MASRRLVYEFFGIDAGATATFDKMEGNLARGAGSWSKFAAGAGVAVAALAAYSIKQAMDFQKSTELIHTQAGRSVSDLDSMRKGILGMAGAVGTGPEALSEALFHIASTGLNAKRSLDELRIAAEGAQIGNADLTDVTNALNATIVSGIKGAGNFAHAMGALNAIVGAGDMHMQDLADALGSGVLAVVKTFGVSLTEAGAALATFGDNNIRGAQAATYLRQTVQSISVASPKADAALAQVGLSASALQDALAKGGLTGALDLLHSHFASSGIAANKWGAILSDAFTKKAATGISVLMSQFGRYQLKQQEVADGAGHFGDEWAATTKNLSFQMDRLRADVEVLAIKIGTDLIPAAMEFLKVLFAVGGAVGDVIGWLDKHRAITLALAAAITSTLLPSLERMTALLSVDTLMTFANGLSAMTLRLIGTKSALGAVNDQAGVLSKGIGGPLTIALTAAAYMWEKNREQAQASREQVDAYVSSLNVQVNSLSSVKSAIAQVTAAQKNFTNANIEKMPHSDFGPKFDEYTKQIQDLQATEATVRHNTALLATGLGLTRQQVVALANSLGLKLNGNLSDLEGRLGAATVAAQQSHHPNQQAAADFKDMSSKATTLSTALTDLSDAWDNYVGAFTGLKEQQDAFNAQLRTLRKELKKSGGSLTDNGKAATKARDTYLGLVDKIGEVTSATYKNSAQQDKAVAAATRMRNSLEKLGASGPLARAELQKLDAFIASFKDKMNTQGTTSGTAYGQGLAAGLASMRSAVAAEAAALAAVVDPTVRRHLQARSPSRKARKTGQDYGKGLSQGIDDTKKMVTLSAKRVTSLLFSGMTQGWTGMAARIKNALGTHIQNELTRFTDHLAKELSRQQDLLSKAEDKYKSLKKARHSAISGLADSISGSADISNVLNQTRTITTTSGPDFTGGSSTPGETTTQDVNYTGNIASFLKGQLGPLKAEAKGLAKLRKMGLSQALISQIAAQSPTDAVALINQILSGQDGSIASLNKTESTIRSLAKQTATTVVESPHEKAQLKVARTAVMWARWGVEEQRETNRHLMRLVSHSLGHNLTVKVSGGSLKHLTMADAASIRKILNKYDHSRGHK